MPMLVLLLLLLLDLGNGQNDPPIPCPFRLYCTDNEVKMLELPAVPVPVKLLLRPSYVGSKTLEAYDPENCLPELFLRVNYSSFVPFRSTHGNEESYGWTNITFFNCSSIGQRHLRNEEQTFPNAPDMLSCPIYVADDFDDVVDLDLVSCTKLFRRVLPVPTYEIQANSFLLEQFEKNFASGCFVDCKKSGKKRKSIILAAIGEKRVDQTLRVQSQDDFFFYFGYVVGIFLYIKCSM